MVVRITRCVEQHDAEMLRRSRAERGQEVPRGIFKREELRALVEWRRQRSPTQLERRQELGGFRRPDPRYRREIVAPGAGQAVEAAPLPQEFVRHAQRSRAPASAAKN
jgi:hypothetical protein